MNDQKQSIVDRIKQANNILVTVSANPSVDQLAACLGLTIALNEVGKHATAVFSGQIPSTIEFLKPEKTIEKNTDSLRDFIIALDKSKADKLRYKVEDKVVKIFITPYRTSISDKDLEFSQGDFNVEVVVCLGVRDQKDLDQAITSHGRILHDATVIGINTVPGPAIGTLSWVNDRASSLSEMVASVADEFGKKVLDNQIATALLTGIVAETERFSNPKTSPATMSISAQLMAAGANQQLVASELQAPPAAPEPASEKPAAESTGVEAAELPKSADGTLRIDHEHDPIPPAAISEEDIIDNSSDKNPTEVELPQQEAESSEATPEKSATEEEKKPEPQSVPKEKDDGEIHIDDSGQLHQLGVHPREFLGDDHAKTDYFSSAQQEDEKPSGAPPENNPKFVLTPPTLGGTLTANSRPEGLESTVDPLSLPKVDQPLLSHEGPAARTPQQDNVVDTSHAGLPPLSPSVAAALGQSDGNAPPQQDMPADSSVRTSVNDARAAVDAVADDTKGPIAALNALPLGGSLHEDDTQSPQAELHIPANEAAPNAASPADRPLDMPLPPNLTPPPANNTPPTSSNGDNPSAPPPVPPPMMPPMINPDHQ
jgi:hypothetical protein